MRGTGPAGPDCPAASVNHLELEAELHRRIEEAGETASNGTTSFSGALPKERPTSNASSLTERSQNWCCRTMVISSGYFSPRRWESLTPGKPGLERDVEMMLAGQAVARRIRQHASHHAAKSVLRQKIVADVIRAHCAPVRGPYQAGPQARKKVEASVARCLRTPPAGATRQDFDSV